jgi:hypothetical protein
LTWTPARKARDDQEIGRTVPKGLIQSDQLGGKVSAINASFNDRNR